MIRGSNVIEGLSRVSNLDQFLIRGFIGRTKTSGIGFNGPGSDRRVGPELNRGIVYFRIQLCSQSR